MGVFQKGSIFLLLVSAVVLYQNCAPLEGTGGLTVGSLGGAAEYQAVQAIVDGKCVTCHASASASNRNVGLANYQAILDSGVVVPGNSSGSRMYQQVENGTMPQNAPALSVNEVNIIRSWIDSGAPDVDGVVANETPLLNAGADQTVQLPTGNIEFIATASDIDGAILRSIWTQNSGPTTASLSGSMTTTLTVSSGSLTSGTYVFEIMVEDDFGALVFDQVNLIVQAALPPSPPPNPTVFFATNINPILQGRCFTCHSGATPSGNTPFSVESYAQVITRITAGNAGASLLFNRVNADEMPQGGPALPASEKTLIQTWINEGALNN